MIVVIKMIERQKHLDAFEYFIKLGGQPNDENTMKTAQEFGVSKRTIFVWYKELNWRDRSIIRLVQARNKAEENGILDKEAEIAALLTLVKSKIAESNVRSTYLKVLYGTAKDLIANKQLEIKSIADLTLLAKAIDGQDKNLLDLIKVELLLIGEPDSRQDQTGGAGFTLYNIRYDDLTFPKPFDVPDNGEESGKIGDE